MSSDKVLSAQEEASDTFPYLHFLDQHEAAKEEKDDNDLFGFFVASQLKWFYARFKQLPRFLPWLNNFFKWCDYIVSFCVYAFIC